MPADEGRQRRIRVGIDVVKVAMERLRRAERCLQRAFELHLASNADDAEDHFGKASEAVADALDAILNVEPPGVEGGSLPMRESGSGSVYHAPDTNIQEFAWKSDRIGATAARQRKKRHDAVLATSGHDALSSSAILQNLARAGWGPEQIAGYIHSLLELTKTEGTIKQRSEVLKLLMASIQHTEPRTLFEMKDIDLADLSEDELDVLTREAARHVAEQAARLQAGLPPDTLEEP